MFTHQDQTQIELCLANDATLDDDGWVLIAPYGEHPKSRIAKVKGVPTLQTFIQVLDNDSADALMAKENSFFRKIKRAIVGIPVYGSKGVPHPDLQDHAPETLSNARGEKKVIGVVDQVRKCGSYIILVKEGEMITLSIPDHKEVAKGTLRSLIRAAGITVEEFAGRL
jgi:predicted RNA binding protein YcfA (HicA-like mRNA interferase family)